MSIQWFPGHMTRARREIEAKLKLIDVVIELLDARIPLSSRNPMIDEIIQQKPRIILLNKSDLADPSVTDKWVEYFAALKLKAIPVDASTGHRLQEIALNAKELLKDKIDAQIRKGMNPRAIRGLIVGIPNVGKSTLINKLAGKSIALTGDKPGVTKGQQWIKVGKGLELLDTPGILWPKFEDQEVGLRLAVTGAIKEEILNIEEAAFYAVRFLAISYPHCLLDRFGIEELPSLEEQNEANAIVNIMEQFGRKRGCLQSGGTVNLEKASSIILRELRAGKLGKISIEQPNL